MVDIAPTIARVETGHYRIPLPHAMTDSRHGEMLSFEIVTARVIDSEGNRMALHSA